MTLQETIATLVAHKGELSAMKVRSISVFGSVARNEATSKSDVDLLVEFSAPVGLFHFARLRRSLSAMLGVQADVVTRAALRSEMRDVILREAVRAA